MNDDVARETVILVLKAHGVTVTEGGEEKVTIIKDKRVEVHRLPAIIGHRIVVGFARKFGVPAHLFWHPEMMPDEIRPPGLVPS
jgi:hypothetical protein